MSVERVVSFLVHPREARWGNRGIMDDRRWPTTGKRCSGKPGLTASSRVNGPYRSTRHLREVAAPRWRTRHRRRIVVAQTSAADQQSFWTSGAESDHLRSPDPRVDHAAPESWQNPEMRRVHQACDVVQIPRGFGGPEIPASVLRLVPSP